MDCVRKPCIAHNPELEPHRCLHHHGSEGGFYSLPALPDLGRNFVMSTAPAQGEHWCRARVDSWSASATRRQRSGSPKYPLLPFCKYRIVDSPADVERKR